MKANTPQDSAPQAWMTTYTPSALTSAMRATLMKKPGVYVLACGVRSRRGDIRVVSPSAVDSWGTWGWDITDLPGVERWRRCRREQVWHARGRTCHTRRVSRRSRP